MLPGEVLDLLSMRLGRTTGSETTFFTVASLWLFFPVTDLHGSTLT
jgi:hypothetical protein